VAALKIEVPTAQKAEGSMITKALKWTAIAALTGGLLWRSSEVYSTLLQFVVSVVATVVIVQAAAMRRYVWMSLFLLAVSLFNPVLPLVLSRSIYGLVSLLTALLFFFSVELLQPKRRLTIASITSRGPGSESL
jgi:Family of unknown function (DUF6804)